MFIINIFNKIIIFFKENKSIGLVSLGMILLLLGLFGYKTFYSNPDNVVKFSTYGGNDTRDVEKTISKNSVLGKKLPCAEEIITKINDTEDKDLEIFDIVYNEFGEDVAKLFEVGLIPSSLLDDNDNIKIILSGNSYLDMESNYFPPEYLINTYDYINSLGEIKPRVILNPASKFKLPESVSYDFLNIDSKLSTKNLEIQGVFLNKPNLDNLSSESYLIAFNKFNSDIENIKSEEEFLNKIENNYILTLNFVLNKNMKVSEIYKELSELKLNDSEISNLSFNEVPNDIKNNFSPSVNLLEFIKENKGDDYEIASYSILQAKFYTGDSVKIYSNSNYLSYKDKQIELSNNKSVEFSNDLLYNDYEFK